MVIQHRREEPGNLVRFQEAAPNNMPRWLVETGTPNGLRSRAFASSNLAWGTMYQNGHSAMGRGTGFKIPRVWVRIPVSVPGPGGQIGKVASLRSRKVCEFESHPGHQHQHPCGQIGKAGSLKRSSSVGSNPTRGTIYKRRMIMTTEEYWQWIRENVQ